MLATRKLPSVQAILPNVQEYIEKVDCFYQQKVQHMIFKISQFIQLANQLTEIPEHLALQFNYIKRMPHITYEQRQIEKLMIFNQIEKFLNLKNEVVESSIGHKYHYPELPKIQRKKLTRRKFSQAQQISSSESEKNDSGQLTVCSSTVDQNESMNQITNLLGTLNLQNKTNDQIYDSIENIVAQMSQISLDDQKNSKVQDGCKLNQDKDNTMMELEQLRYQKKIEIFHFQVNLHEEKRNQTVNDSFNTIMKEKLFQLKQNFRIHLQNQVQQVVTKIKQILIKAVSDFKKYDKAYVPIHKISSYFKKLNLKFYTSQGVIKSLHKYLTKKIKQCIVDSEETYHYNGSEVKVKTNFRLRFFKHILIENIFFIWLKNAVIDMKKMLKENSTIQKKFSSSRRIQCQNCQEQPESNSKDFHLQQYEKIQFFPNRKDSHSFEHFIM